MQRILTMMSMFVLVGALGCFEKVDGNAGNNAEGATRLTKTPTWILKQITLDGVAHQAVPNAKATISFGNKNVRGSSGCNSFGGTYTARANGSIKFHEVGMTEMACPGPRMQQEERFSKVLWRLKQYKVDAKQLVLSDGTAKNELRYVPYVPNHLPLQGTTWTLKHFTQSDAQTASAEPAQNKQPITLRFVGGEMSGFGGCNRFSGNLKVLKDGRVAIQTFGMTKKLCHGIIGQHESKFVQTLPQMTRQTIRENILTLTNNAGTQGLQFEGRSRDAK